MTDLRKDDKDKKVKKTLRTPAHIPGSDSPKELIFSKEEIDPFTSPSTNESNDGVAEGEGSSGISEASGSGGE